MGAPRHMMLVTLAFAAAALLAAGAPTLCHASNSPIYWWRYNQTDCPYDDVPANGTNKAANCCPAAGCKTDADFEACKAACLGLATCGGFNYPHGVLKRKDCINNRTASPTVDLYLAETAPQPAPPSNFPPVWPHPTQFSNGSTSLLLTQPFAFILNGSQSSPILNAAFARYKTLFFPHRAPGAGAGGSHRSDGGQRLRDACDGVVVAVRNLSEDPPQQGTDESYTLSVPLQGEVQITAATVYGALHGLETLSQLIRFNFSAREYTIEHAPWEITDRPRFAFRGVMVDTSRHFIPIPVMQRVALGMAHSKLNVFHWHHSDSQSFPMEFRNSAPRLWDASYSAASRYSREDVQDFVAFCQQLGIRVLVEFDMPGHAQSWCTGYPEICPSPTCTTPLNPANTATFDLVAALLQEAVGNKSAPPMFPERMIHLGGDEVDYSCWSNTPSIKSWMDSHGYSTTDTYGYFIQMAHKLARAQNVDFINWVEVYERLKGTQWLDKDTIVHVWKGRDELAEVLSAGFRAILSDSNQWYLTAAHSSHNWTVFYDNEPLEGLSPAQAALVIGGEVCSWNEYVDSGCLEGMIFPRAAAAAEKLWSPANISTIADAQPRLAAFRCLLNRRGIGASSLHSPDNAAAGTFYKSPTSPSQPGACLDQ